MSSISGQIEDAIRALRGARLMDHESGSAPHHFACAPAADPARNKGKNPPSERHPGTRARTHTRACTPQVHADKRIHYNQNSK